MSAALLSHTVQAEPAKRLAFSKKSGVEVLTHGEKWCAETASIELIAASDTFFTDGRAQAFMRKVGKAVIPEECARATSVTVIGKHAGTEKSVFHGMAKKADSWLLVATTTPDVKTPAVVEDKPVIAITPIAEKATLNSQNQENKTVQAAAEVDKAEPKQAEVEQVPLVEGKVPVLMDDVFSIGGYRPHDNFKAPTENVMAIDTIDSCTVYGIEDQSRWVSMNGFSKDWIAFPKGEFSCEAGALNGQGIVEFKNLDARVMQTFEGTVIQGYLFANIPDGWQLQSIDKFQRTDVALFHVESIAELETHIIGVLNYDKRKLSFGPTASMYAMSDHDILLAPKTAEEVIRQYRGVVDNSGKRFANRSRFYAYESLADFRTDTKALNANCWRKKCTITNQVAQNEQKRLAEVARKVEAERLRLFRLERQMEKDFIAFGQLDEKALKQKILGNYDEQFSKQHYQSAAESALDVGHKRYSWMIHVDDIEDGELIEIDFPTEMTGQSTEIETAGWYIVDADISGVIGETDKSGFIQPKLDNVTVRQSCVEEKCNEYTDALTVIRVINSMPEWSPKANKEMTK